MALSILLESARAKSWYGASIAVLFAIVFAALASGWIRLGQGSAADRIWIGAFFAFQAVWMAVPAQFMGRSRACYT